MPFTQDGLPFARGSHTSYKSAVQSGATRDTAKRRYLEALEAAGEQGLTDHEASDEIGRPLSSICAIRNLVAAQGYVGRAGERIGKYDRACTVWIYVRR